MKTAGKTGMYWREVHRGDKTYVQRFRAKKSTGVAGRVAKPKSVGDRATRSPAPKKAPVPKRGAARPKLAPGELRPKQLAGIERRQKRIEGRMAKIDTRREAARARLGKRIEKINANHEKRATTLFNRAKAATTPARREAILKRMERVESGRMKKVSGVEKKRGAMENRLAASRRRLETRHAALKAKLDAHRAATGGKAAPAPAPKAAPAPAPKPPAAPARARVERRKAAATPPAAPAGAGAPKPPARVPIAVRSNPLDAVNVKSSNIAPTVQTGMNAIGKAHQLPTPPPAIDVHSTTGRPVATQSRGTYFLGSGMGPQDYVAKSRASVASRRIEVNPMRGDAFTFVHEYGHFLDHTFFGSGNGGSNTMGSNGASFSPEMTALMGAIQGSSSHEAIRAYRAAAKTNRLRRHADYLLNRHELFARAYSQYVAMKSNDPDLRIALSQRLTDQGISAMDRAAHWDHEDFRPIHAAVDRLFAAHGLSH